MLEWLRRRAGASNVSFPKPGQVVRWGIDDVFRACVLQQQPFVLRALARRYPHILIDEAQDIGSEHQALLEMLIAHGTRLSLIGDQHQGIYEFSGANGRFLETYATKDGVISGSLTTNYRSVPLILGVANKLSGREDSPDRSAPTCMNGAYYVPYKAGEKDKLLSAFHSMLVSAQVNYRDAVVVCRAAKWVKQWRDGELSQGQGAVKSFIEATILRDKLGQLEDAFQMACSGLIALLADEHGGLASIVTRGSPQSVAVPLRRAVWSFVRDAENGLPDGKLLADTEWHPKMKANVLALLTRLNTSFELKSADNLGMKLKNQALLHQPVVQLADLGAGQPASIEVSTVHQVKGESIDAVMYVADKSQIQELLGGTKTEVGRIGYVAVTRTRNLLVLATPESCIAELEPALVACGFQRPGAA